MKTIKISEGVTATLTNKTYKAMREYEAETEKLNRWKDSAFSERDWGDYEYYCVLQEKLDEKFAWLWE